MNDAVRGATRGITIQKNLGQEIKRVGEDIKMLVGHIGQVPGVDKAIIDIGVDEMKMGIQRILSALPKAGASKE